MDGILQPMERLLEHFGAPWDWSWSRLKASRATLGVFWTISGRPQVDNMILDTQIDDFGDRFGLQTRRKFALDSGRTFEVFWGPIYG